jgi:hypothetical protein
MCELLVDKSIVCGRLWCVARQVSSCRAAVSADARGSGSVMEVIHTGAVRWFEWVVSIMSVSVTLRTS